MVRSQSVENSRHTIRLCRRILYHYRKEIWSLSQLSFFPTHCIAPYPPLRGLSTPLVMTMLQTGLLSHGALPELQFKLYKKRKNP